MVIIYSEHCTIRKEANCLATHKYGYKILLLKKETLTKNMNTKPSQNDVLKST